MKITVAVYCCTKVYGNTFEKTVIFIIIFVRKHCNHINNRKRVNNISYVRIRVKESKMTNVSAILNVHIFECEFILSMCKGSSRK
jgi:hypothetical protein